MTSVSTVPTTQWLDIAPTVKVQLCLDGSRLLGLGEVVIQGVTVRAGRVLLRPDFSTVDAVHYQDFQLMEIVRQEESTVVRTRALGRPEVLSNDLMDEYDFTISCLSVREVQEDTLEWILTPQQLELDGEAYAGLSLGFRFTSAVNEIHRFFTLGTWEIGGQATGNTIYHQSQVGEPVYTAAPETHYTTACLKRLDLWHDPMGISYQLCPRWASMQPFDFQAAKEGVLLGYWQDKHAVKSLIQKNPGEEVIFVLDEYDFPLANEVTIPAKHILFSPSPAETPRAAHEVVNMWTRAHEYTGQIIRDFYGITLCAPLPADSPVGVAGTSSIDRAALAKGPQDDWLWRQEHGKFYFMLDGEKIESHEFLDWTADHVLPRMAAQGIKRLRLIQPIHESDFSEMAFAYHAETGWHGDLHVSSVCATHRYAPAEFFGGWRGWRYLAEKARALDMSIGHWIGLHISPRSPILREYPDYAIRHANTKRYGGGYGPETVIAFNWASSGARQWFLDDLRRWHDEGLNWLWFDSWPNLVCLTSSYLDRMTPLQMVAPEVLAELQQIGYDWFGFEGTSPFGCPAYGLADPMQDYEGHVQQGVCGQNDLGKRIGHEYMAYNEALLHIGLNPARDMSAFPEWSFRYIANRSLNLVTATDTQTYLRLLPLLQKRYLLPADRGVCWKTSDGRQALFAYQAFPYPVPAGLTVTQVTGTTETPIACADGVLHTQPFTAYRLA
ncbi:MAG TPA: hypothetical protein VGM23_03410 [Armatimonadota bacterium]|jgi:hypothetical protein